MEGGAASRVLVGESEGDRQIEDVEVDDPFSSCLLNKSEDSLDGKTGLLGDFFC